MRVSTATINSMATGATSGAYGNYVDILTKIASGKNFTKMSENVTDAKKLIKIKDQIAKLEEYQSNIKAATNEMSLAYDTLGDVNDELSYINSKIVEASNATTTPDSAKAIAEEIKQRTATIVNLMNTKYMDKYIFSGTNTETQAYSLNEETGEVTYNGSSTETADRYLTIAEGTTTSYNVSGAAIFNDITLYSTDADGNTVEVKTDFFSEMQELNDLLNADTLDYDAIRSKLDVMDAAVKNVTNQTGIVSARVSKLDTASGINESTMTTLSEKRSEIEDVDIISAATQLANAQTALQASYAVSSVVLGSVSLLDYL